MKTRIFLAGLALAFLFTACSKSPKLKVEGTISHAKGKVLYFEQTGINSTDTLDSIKLDTIGRFNFSTKLPGSPEFYRLRIGNQFIQLGADTSVKINILADARDLGKTYQVEGSRSCEQIRILSGSQMKIQLSIDSLNALYNNQRLSDTAYQNQALTLLEKHRTLARKIILESPRAPVAYFALFQRIHDLLIFDPYDKNDNQMFSAVATAWQTFYPESNRGKNLIALTLQGIKSIRQAQKKVVIDEANTISYFEVKLPDLYGKEIALSSLIGKVILLDFTAYQTKTSPGRNLQFRTMYNKYAKQGFEIYQVSFDTDENLWKTGASNLPWICVHDRNSLDSKYLSQYNIQGLPTYFLLDRKGNLVVREQRNSDLDQEILKLL